MQNFHHAPGQKNPTKKGSARMTKEELAKKKNGYGTYTIDEIINESETKKHKKNKVRPRC